MHTIKVIPENKEHIEVSARFMLAGTIGDMGNELVLNKAVAIACKENIPVNFQLPNGNIVSAEMAYALIQRGLSLRCTN